MITDHGAPPIETIRDFWQQHPCANETGDASDRARYFAEIEAYRYAQTPWLRHTAGFVRFSGQRVLEVGCGMGTDGVQFAQGGADYVGVDLTEAAVALARENFSIRGLPGEFIAANAEELPFRDESFDHAYSFGVIHHTTNPEAAVNEIWRTLRPGGSFTVMLYNRTSVNYYLEIQGLRRLGRLLLRAPSAPRLLARTLRLPEDKLRGHREQLLRIPHPTPEQWISMNTDGPECPLARVYSAAEARALFGQFADVTTEVYFFDRSHWPVLEHALTDRAAEAIGRWAGWCRIVHGRKAGD